LTTPGRRSPHRLRRPATSFASQDGYDVVGGPNRGPDVTEVLVEDLLKALPRHARRFVPLRPSDVRQHSAGYSPGTWRDCSLPDKDPCQRTRSPASSS